MPNDYIAKLKTLSPALQAKLSDEDFLAKLDAIDEQYGVKAVLILLGLLTGEIDYIGLADKLKADYNLNDFLAQEIKGKFGGLITELGSVVSASVEKKNEPAIASEPISYSDADEEEVKKYINAAAPAKTDYSVQAKNILNAFGFADQDMVMAKRLENIIIAKLRDVRDDLETKEGLMKSKKVGGLEFAEADADRLLKLINTRDFSAELALSEAEWGRNDNGGARNQPTIEMEDGLPVVRMPLAVMDQAKTVAISANELPQPIYNDKIKPPAFAPAELRRGEAEILPLPTPQPFIAEKIIPESVLNAKTASHPNLDDVKLKKNLMGPIEELENMTIIDFRRLANDPLSATDKIREKIELLGKAGLNEKIAGIAAWGRSEVSRFYRLLGQLSMSQNRNIEEAIKERLMSGKPTLSLDEFHAIMELNRQLRF